MRLKRGRNTYSVLLNEARGLLRQRPPQRKWKVGESSSHEVAGEQWNSADNGCSRPAETRAGKQRLLGSTEKDSGGLMGAFTFVKSVSMERWNARGIFRRPIVENFHPFQATELKFLSYPRLFPSSHKCMRRNHFITWPQRATCKFSSNTRKVTVGCR